jgi:restriction system protein
VTDIKIKSKHMNQIETGRLWVKWSADGNRVIRYYVDFRQKGMTLHRELSAPDLATLQSKTDALMSTWDRRYDEVLRKSQVAVGRNDAESASIAAANRIAALSRILARSSIRDPRLDWESLKGRAQYERRPFEEARPRLRKSNSPVYIEPRVSLFDVLFGRAAKKRAVAEAAHREELRRWSDRELVVEDMHAADLKAWQARKGAHELAEANAHSELEKAQAEANIRIDSIRDAVLSGDPSAIVELASIVLDRSDYEELFEKDFSVDYDPDAKTLFVDYELPSPDVFPSIKSVKFLPSTGEMVETKLSDREQKSNYDSACYQVALRSLHELFGADEARNLERISFNGYVTATNRATGHDIRPCIISLVVKRDEFQAVDLARVDPKACFKSLKGVSAASLAALVAIPPVMQMNRADKRFVDGRDVAHTIDDGTNLAAMSWEDFEHLVRQLFERIYSSSGGEVRITQASRDGGVDAVAFDPDPIRGGKTVIQAKRYTRVVGVSAVRDLYGTLMNEGASKGILVTTADYGPDAYAFAKDKPIVLISGPQLLHLLGEHGFRARIDIREARSLFGSAAAESY